MYKYRTLIIALGFVTLASSLSACAPILIGGAAIGAVTIYTDRRPANVQTNDKGIQVEVLSELERDTHNSSIEVAVWNKRVLLVGSVPTQEQKDAITQKYSNHPNITHLFNELTVGFKPALVTKTSDGVLTSRIRSAFVATQGINSNSIKIVSEGAKVYLLGWVTQAELERAVSVARQTRGVAEVINLTEIVNKQ